MLRNEESSTSHRQPPWREAREGRRDNAVVDQAAADAFVERWVEAWNSHDLDGIVGHFAEDVVFSPDRA
jgi:ketosteroid isomerase-like protein